MASLTPKHMPIAWALRTFMEFSFHYKLLCNTKLKAKKGSRVRPGRPLPLLILANGLLHRGILNHLFELFQVLQEPFSPLGSQPAEGFGLFALVALFHLDQLLLFQHLQVPEI